MTINNVDVNGCRFLDEYKHCDICKELCERHCLVVEDIECKTYDDCYYKQLQRAKQDNKNIKKAFNDILLEILEMRPYDGEIRADGNTPLVVIRNYKKEYRQYKQTLQEIKAIAEELSCKHPEECFENKPDWNGEVYGCDVADNWKNPSELATCPSKLASAILQIIIKVGKVKDV